METPQTKQGSNRNLIIAVVVIIVLCCCCIVIGIGGYYGYKGYIAAQEVKNSVENFLTPSAPTDPDQPSLQIPGIPGLDNADLPQGGLSDDVTRATAWGSLLVTGPVFGCSSPTASGTEIEVLSDPDSSGEWVENWTVDCGDGTTKPFKITFTPENGVTNINVTPAE